jgi:hypothetical protein
VNIEKSEDGCEYIINPTTKRKLKVGSVTYNKLIKANVLKIDPNELGRVLYCGESKEEAIQAKNKIPVKEPMKSYVRGKKVYQTARKLKQNEMNSKIKEVTLKVYELNKDKFNENMSIDEIQTLIKRLVDETLISEDSKDIPIKRELEFLVEHAESDDEADEDEDQGDNDDVSDLETIPEDEEKI